MVTGASTADAALVLVDAGQGVKPQTRRHAAIAALLGVRLLVLVVKKVDLHGTGETEILEIGRPLWRGAADDPGELSLNGAAEVRLRVAAPVAADPYSGCRATGSLILIGGDTGETAAAGMIVRVGEAHPGSQEPE